MVVLRPLLCLALRNRSQERFSVQHPAPDLQSDSVSGKRIGAPQPVGWEQGEGPGGEATSDRALPS